MRFAMLALVLTLAATPAAVAQTDQPTPADQPIPLESAIRDAIGSVLVQPSLNRGPPSEVHGYVVFRDPNGALQPVTGYPTFELLFRDLNYPDQVRRLRVHQAAQGLQNVQVGQAQIIAYRYRFRLIADRLTSEHPTGIATGLPGIEYLAADRNAVRFNPDAYAYEGVEVSYQEPPSGVPGLHDGRVFSATPRSTAYTDVNNFTR